MFTYSVKINDTFVSTIKSTDSTEVIDLVKQIYGDYVKITVTHLT